MTSLIPNMVIVKFDDDLISFPMSEDGEILPGEAFESDYELEDYNLVFASYNVMEQTSTELYRFSFLDEGKEQKVKLLYEDGKLPDFVKYIVETHLK